MKIRIITPSLPQSRAGNQTTTIRWARILRSLGHRVDVSRHYHGQPADLMVALHAWRSADAIAEFALSHPDNNLIVAITGTDAYRFIHSHPDTTLHSLLVAHRLVGLHDLIADALPAQYRHKVRIIYQSARPIQYRRPVKRSFRVCVAGHLRDEKDSLRPAFAVRSIPAQSRLQIEHFGKAHTPEWAQAATQEMEHNSRYRWHGEVSHAKLRRYYASSHLLALPSRMEGGANVISESIVAGLPIIASNIAGSVGLLGKDYPGYYKTEDTHALRNLLLKAESDNLFYANLDRSCNQLKTKFTPEQEQKSWELLLKELD